MKKVICAVLSAVMVGATLTACGDKEEEHSHGMIDGSADNVSMNSDEMPYGAMIHQLLPANDSNIKYTVEFDKRYFGGEGEEENLREIYAIHDYIVAINEDDHEKFKELYYPKYLDYLCGLSGYATVDAYLTDMNTQIKELLGDDFEIDFINVSNCYTESDSEGASVFADVDKYLNEVDSSALGKITSKKYVEIGGYTCYSSGDNDYVLVNHANPFYLCVYEIDGKMYIL